MNEVKRYTGLLLDTQPFDAPDHDVPYVLASDYDTLKAEVERLRGDLQIANLQKNAKLCSQCPRNDENERLRTSLESCQKARVHDVDEKAWLSAERDRLREAAP